MSGVVGWEAHTDGVRRLVASYAVVPPEAPVRLAKPTSNLFRSRTRTTVPGLDVSGLRGAVSAGASSGVRSFEAAALVTEGLVSLADLAVLREFGVGVPVHVAGADGVVREVLQT